MVGLAAVHHAAPFSAGMPVALAEPVPTAVRGAPGLLATSATPVGPAFLSHLSALAHL